MKKTTVMTIVGTRPEIIKLSEVMKELDKHTNHIIVHTGQNYDYEVMIKNLIIMIQQNKEIYKQYDFISK